MFANTLDSNLKPLRAIKLITFRCCLKYRFFLFVCFISTITQVNAQILNVERARIEQDSVNYMTGKAGLNFSMFNRNAGKNNPNNFLQLTFNSDVAYISAKHSYLLLNYYNYLLINYDNEEQRNTIASNGYAHFRVNLYRQRRLSYELFTQLQSDRARGLELRTLAGAGVRYAILRKPKTSLYFGTGVMHEYEKWQSPVETQGIIESSLPKMTNYISNKAVLNDLVTTEAIVYYQTGYDKSIDAFRNRISGDMNLVVKLNSTLSFRTGFNCTFEDKPLVPVTRFVYAITNGVQVNF
jgi:hypothetical protein